MAGQEVVRATRGRACAKEHGLLRKLPMRRDGRRRRPLLPAAMFGDAFTYKDSLPRTDLVRFRTTTAAVTGLTPHRSASAWLQLHTSRPWGHR